MIRAIVCAAALALLATGAMAQQEPVFRDYAEMRQELDSLMKARRVGDLMNRFGGSTNMSDEEVADLETRLRRAFPFDFKHVDVIRVAEMQNGWSQELYAFRTGLSYVYVSVLLHQREDSLVAVNIRFNPDFYELNRGF